MAVRAVKKCNYKNIELLRVALNQDVETFAKGLGMTKPTYLKYLVSGGWTRQQLKWFEEVAQDTKYKKKNVGWFIES